MVNTLTPLDVGPQKISHCGWKASDNNVDLFKLEKELNAEVAKRKTFIEALEKEMEVLKGRIFPYLASSRRFVSWDAARKTEREKIKKVRREKAFI